MTQTIYNSQDTAFKKPFGAVKTGQEVSFTLRVPSGLECRTPYLFLMQDGQPFKQLGMHARGGEYDRDIFTLSITLDEPGLYFYYFDLWTGYRKIFEGFCGEAFLTTEQGRPYQLTVYDAAFKTPEELRGKVMYQIFPDRFLEGNPEKEQGYNERIYRADKTKEPYFWPNDQKDGYLTMDYFGGDLKGIQKRLPFLMSLGVGWIYLNPIFEAHSNHRYNTADYLNIDPYLGTNEDFIALCAEAKKLGIRVMLDGVFSHTGSDSIYFNREGRYPSVGAWQGRGSLYYDWFSWRPDGWYDSWWGFETLPNINKSNKDFRKFVCGEGGVIDTWLQRGASGFRLDVVDELPDDFVAEIRTAIKRNGKDKLLIGEVWEDASNKMAYSVRRRYFLGQELDGVMNYPLREAILQFVDGHDAPSFANVVNSLCEHYPEPALAATTNHLSTHDTVRAITALAGDPLGDHDRDWQSGRRLNPQQYNYGMVRMQVAFVLQFTMPGVPCVYYGDEIGMQGYKDPFNRAYYDWHSGETTLIRLMMQLSQLRRTCKAFKGGRVVFHTAKDGILVYERRYEGEVAMVGINCSGWPATVQLLGEEVTIPVMGYAWRTGTEAEQEAKTAGENPAAEPAEK